MSGKAECDLKGIGRLLLAPTPENMLRLNNELEALAIHLLSIKSALSQDPDQPELRLYLLEVQAEMTRVRHLLEGAFYFFNALAARHSSPAYQCNGFLQPPSTRVRTLAQL